MVLILGVMMVGCANAQDAVEPIDLSEATAFADKFFSDTSLYASELGEILDGDAETFWCCGNHDLSEGAANLFIMPPEPVTSSLRGSTRSRIRSTVAGVRSMTKVGCRSLSRTSPIFAQPPSPAPP